jgi:DNA-binding FadR family transcriptional regulator
MLGLTRTQLRSGMKQLEDEGLIWRHVGRGTFYGARPASHGTGHSTAKPDAAAVEASNPRELMEARVALEPQLARLASAHATSDDLVRLERCLERAIAAPNARLFMTLDGDLHLAIAEASHNTLLIDLFKSMNAVRHRVLWGKLDGDFLTTELRKQYDGHHRGIVQAIARREGAQAESQMRFHLEVVERQLMTVALLFRP